MAVAANAAANIADVAGAVVVVAAVAVKCPSSS